jgi:hypothetical protein
MVTKIITYTSIKASIIANKIITYTSIKARL